MQKANNTSDRSPIYLWSSLSFQGGCWCSLITGFFFFFFPFNLNYHYHQKHNHHTCAHKHAHTHTHTYTHTFSSKPSEVDVLSLCGAAPRRPAGADLLAASAGQWSLSMGLDGWVEPCGASTVLWAVAVGAAEERGSAPVAKKRWGQHGKKAPSLAPGLLLSLFTQQIDPLCSFRPLSKPLHSSAELYLLHYALLIIQVYRTNKAICPVSTCLAGGLKRTAPSHHSGSLDIHHQSRRLHCLCTPVCMVNTAAQSKFPRLGRRVWLHTSAFPLVGAPAPCRHLRLGYGASQTNF